MKANFTLLQILMKWGEYSNDVQFILQWNDNNKNQVSNKLKSPPANTPVTPHNVKISVESPERNKEIQKSLTFRYQNLKPFKTFI